MSTTNELLSQNEVERLILAVAHANKDGTFTESDARQVLEWAEGVRIDSGLLEAVLKGDFSVRPDPETGEMSFALTEQGRRNVEAMGGDR